MPSPMNDILYDEFWNDLRARLDTATPSAPGLASMRQILKGAARVYILGLDELPESSGPQTEAWGRLVIIPTLTLWPQVEIASQTTPLAFLVRAEVNDWKADGYQPARKLGLAQSEAYQLLDGWLPDPYERLLLALPLRRHTAPTPVPLQDRGRGVLITSSEYRTEVAGLAPAA